MDCAGAVGFSADAQVHELLACQDIIKVIALRLGSQVIGPDGMVVRQQLREVVFAQPEVRVWIENLIHPMVLARYEEVRMKSVETPAKVLVAEVPLLNESGLPFTADQIVAVAVSPSVQAKRLMARRGLNPQAIEQLRAAQWSALKTAEMADKVVWNDGSPQLLALQAHLLAQQLKKHE